MSFIVTLTYFCSVFLSFWSHSKVFEQMYYNLLVYYSLCSPRCNISYNLVRSRREVLSPAVIKGKVHTINKRYTLSDDFNSLDSVLSFNVQAQWHFVQSKSSIKPAYYILNPLLLLLYLNKVINNNQWKRAVGVDIKRQSC